MTAIKRMNDHRSVGFGLRSSTPRLWLALVVLSTSAICHATDGSFPQCVIPLPGAGNCLEVTVDVGGCTNEACCRAICGIAEECCTEFWSLDCAVTAGWLRECAVVTKCPVTCPVGGLTEAEPCGDNTNGGCNSSPAAFPQTLSNGSTICGTLWIDEITTCSRDTDWYKVIVTTPSRLEWHVRYEGAPVTVYILQDPDGECGEDLRIISGCSYDDTCDAHAVACVQPGTYYVFVAHSFSGNGAGPFQVLCSSAEKDYLATLTVSPDDPSCSVQACAEGASVLTQSASQTILPCHSAACTGATYSQDACFGCLGDFCGAGTASSTLPVICDAPCQTTVNNSFARLFDLAAGATAGRLIDIKCVEAGIEINTGDTLRRAKIRLWRDMSSGPPQTPHVADLTLLGEEAISIPAGIDRMFVRANFDPPIRPPMNTKVLVELFYQDTVDAGLSPAGGVWPGSNTAGQTGPTYALSHACGLTDWIDMVQLGYPNQHFVLNVRYDHACILPADLNCDGDVNGLDIAQLLGQWTGPTPYSPCPPHQSADLNQDCKVNGLDVALLLGAWAA